MNLGLSKSNLYNDGLKNYEEGNLSGAILKYQRSLEAAATEIPADKIFIFKRSTELAQIFIESNQPQYAVDYVNRAFNLLKSDTSLVLSSDESADFLELLGNMTFYFEHFDRAVFCYSHAEFSYTDPNSISLAKAKRYLAQSRLGEISTAIHELRVIISEDKVEADTRNKARKYLADIMAITGHHQEAIDNYQTIFNELRQKYEISTYWLLEALFNMATSNFELGNYGTALSQYKQLAYEITLNNIPGGIRLKMQTIMMIAKICIIIRDTDEAMRLMDSLDEQTLFESDRIHYQLIYAQIELHNKNFNEKGSNKYIEIISGYIIGEVTDEKQAEILTLQSNIHFHHGEFHSAIRILNVLIEYYQKSRNVFQLIIYKLHLCQVLIYSGNDYLKTEILAHLADTEALIKSEPGEVFAIMRQVQMAQLYCMLQEYRHSYTILQQIYNHEWDIFRSYALAGDKEQVFFQDIIDLLLNIIHETSKQVSEQRDALQDYYINLHIKLKSLFLLSSRVFRDIISKPYIQNVNTILSYNQKIKELNSRIFTKSDDYHQLRMEVNYLQHKIKEETDYFNILKELINIRWQDIKEKLEPDEAAVSFTRFESLDGTEPDSSGYSANLIFSDRAHPEFIVLDINDNFIKELLPFNLVRTFDLEGSFHLEVEIPLLHDLATLYACIFKPLKLTLKGIKRIFFTVDGLLNYVPFDALLDEEGNYLVDTFELIQLQNLRDIKVQKKAIIIDSIAIFGGIDFGRFYEGTDDGNTGIDHTLYDLGQIPAAGYENKEISEIFSKKNYRTYLSDHLDLDIFRTVCNEKMPSCLHILTHGFFFNDEQKKYNFEDIYQYKATDIRSHSNPLLRSGIFASDYNYFLYKKEVKPNETGVITSHDISRSHLGKTFLVTIHACESALGAVRNGETYGLTRAFRIAGVNYVIVTLWRIQYTGFYISFYRHLLENGGKDVRAAFTAAISDIRKEHPNPYWWSGFVLVG